MKHRVEIPFIILVLLVGGACAAGEEDDDGYVPPRDDGGADGDVIDIDAPDGGDGLDGEGTEGDVFPDGCTPACTVGEMACEPPPAEENAYRECELDGDGCPAWGEPQTCPTDEVCREDACVEGCSDACADGARQCASATEYQVCAVGSLGCTEWGAATACAAGESCTGEGVCAACADECEEGLAYCSATGQVLACEREASGCTVWADPTSCTAPLICWNGACTAACSDLCASGDMRCFGEDYQICMRMTTCYGWSAPYACPGGRECIVIGPDEGVCPSCSDSCSEGEGRCEDETTYVRCELDPVSGCRVWTDPTSCGEHERCEGAGLCEVVCTDTCTEEGVAECGPGGGPRECVLTEDGCLEWTSDDPCPTVLHGTNVCVDGACELTCETGYLACGASACRLSCVPWVQQSPVPTYDDLFGVDAEGTVAWAVGATDTIATGVSNGTVWRSAGTAAGATTLNHVDFISSITGWAVGDGGAIYRSDDGGAGWTAQTSGITTDLNGVSFADSDHGWAVGVGGVILATDDGGATWTAQTSGVTSELLAVDFVSTATGWAVGASGRILRTVNGGATWTAQTSGTSYEIRDVDFRDETTGWAVGYYYAYRTGDGGTTWIASMRSAIQYHGIHSTSATTATIVGASGRVETTTDGGMSWTTRTSGTTAVLYDLTFFDTLNAVAVGANGTVISSDDGGATWVDRRGGAVENLRDIHFVDANNGWAAGVSGRIIQTGDAGITWTAQTSGTARDLWGVWFADADAGWAVGESGTIVATDDGGDTWAPQTSTTTGALYDVVFISATEGWVVGAYTGGSSVRYTPNGGATWMALPTGVPTTTMYGVWANASGRAWIVGQSGTIRYTIDRGVTWQPPTSTGTSQTLWAVRFVSDSVGFAAGAGGTIVVTTDGGVRWSLRTTPVSAILYGLDFGTATTGFAVGAGGTFLKTTDTGTTWLSFPAPTTRDIRGAAFLDTENGWVAGDRGTVLITHSGGE